MDHITDAWLELLVATDEQAQHLWQAHNGSFLIRESTIVLQNPLLVFALAIFGITPQIRVSSRTAVAERFKECLRRYKRTLADKGQLLPRFWRGISSFDYSKQHQLLSKYFDLTNPGHLTVQEFFEFEKVRLLPHHASIPPTALPNAMPSLPELDDDDYFY